MGYRGAMSTEVRTTKTGKHFLLDPCCRLPSPPSELYQEMYGNLGEIIWEIAHGRVPEIEAVKPFGIEIVIDADWFLNTHTAISFPDEIRNNVKLKNAIKIDGKYYTLNLYNVPECGALVAIGDSFEDCKKQLLKMAPMIEGYGLDIKTDAIDKAIEEFEKMEKA